jgi:hypothetical protein
MKQIKSIFNLLIMLAGMLLVPGTAPAMAAAGHLAGQDEFGGMYDLIGTPPDQGGVGNMSREKLQAITDWMDNPSQKIGQMKNQKVGGEILSTWNHRHQRHDPFAVARALSGDGSADPAIVNAARTHILSDVATGKAGVNGHEIMEEMRREAQVILRYVRRYHKLPLGRLPTWLDTPGPLIPAAGGGDKAGKSTSAENKPVMASKKPTAKLPAGSTKAAALRNAGKAAGIIAVPAAVALTAYEINATEAAYADGKTTEEERDTRHLVTAGAAAGGTAGGIGGTAAGATIGTLICPGPGTIIGGAVGGIAGGAGGGLAGAKAGELAGGTLAASRAEQERALQEATAGACAGTRLSLPPAEYEAAGIMIPPGNNGRD